MQGRARYHAESCSARSFASTERKVRPQLRLQTCQEKKKKIEPPGNLEAEICHQVCRQLLVLDRPDDKEDVTRGF